jgi:hypothetical protein
MRRRMVLFESIKILAVMVLVAPSVGVAQRATQPIRRPLPPGRPNLPLAPGRIYPHTSGVAGAAPSPGVFTVSSVRTRDNIIRLRDADGRSADVYVDSDVFDLSTLQEGDEVAVDFLVPNEGDDQLAASGVWKLEPQRP